MSQNLAIIVLKIKGNERKRRSIDSDVDSVYCYGQMIVPLKNNNNNK